MDLKHLDTPPTRDERAAVDALLGPGSEATSVGFSQAKILRRKLLPALHALQDRVGRITEGGLGYVCRRLHVPPAEAYGVATFYHLFSLDDAPTTVVHVCDDGPCRLRGAEALCEELTARCGAPGTHRRGGTWQRSPCLGLCEQAPAALLRAAGDPPIDVSWGNATADQVEEAIRRRAAPTRAAAEIHQPRDDLHLLRRIGAINPTSIEAYRSNGGFRALSRARELGPTRVIAAVTDSGLVGRGGAAFPTGRKWAAVAGHAVTPHHLICNADESEPGTFKDRVLMEDDPFAVVESIAIAALAVGCEKAWIYLRGEYPLARWRLHDAIEQCEAAGLLGGLQIEIFRGAGAYICGEETALLNSIEGLRGEPRQKPPFPADKGLFQQPTAVNNVETLVNVLDILVDGPAAWAARGVPGSPGTRLFCLCGQVERPGIYEVPMGTRLDALIELAGGTTPGRSVQAVLLGGAAGSFVRGDQLDLPLTFDAVRKAGVTLGSGPVIVLDDQEDVVPFLLRLAEFFHDESCGQCVPCRVGTVRVEEWLHRCAAGKPLGSRETEAQRLADLVAVMKDASICGLGQTAATAVESAVARLNLLDRFDGGAP